MWGADVATRHRVELLAGIALVAIFAVGLAFEILIIVLGGLLAAILLVGAAIVAEIHARSTIGA